MKGLNPLFFSSSLVPTYVLFLSIYPRKGERGLFTVSDLLSVCTVAQVFE